MINKWKSQRLLSIFIILLSLYSSSMTIYAADALNTRAVSEAWKPYFQELATLKIQEMSKKIITEINQNQDKLGYSKDSPPVNVEIDMASYTEQVKKYQFFPSGSALGDVYQNATFKLEGIEIVSSDNTIEITTTQQANKTFLQFKRTADSVGGISQIHLKPIISMTLEYGTKTFIGTVNVNGSIKNLLTNDKELGLPSTNQQYVGKLEGFLENMPSLRVSARSENIEIAYESVLYDNDERFLTDYLNVENAMGRVTIELIGDKPVHFNHVGKYTVNIRVTDEARRTVNLSLNFEVQETLNVKWKNQKLSKALGEKRGHLEVSDWIESVEIASCGRKIAIEDCELIWDEEKRMTSTNIESLDALLRVTQYNIERKVKIPIEVTFGNSIVIKDDLGRPIYAFSYLLEKGESYVYGFSWEEIYQSISIPTMQVSISQHNDSREILLENWQDKWSQSLSNTTVTFEHLEKVIESDFLRILIMNDEDKSKWITLYHDNQSFEMPKLYDKFTYFVIKDGHFELLKLNQLTLKDSFNLSRYNGLKDLGQNLLDFFCANLLNEDTMELDYENVVFQQAGAIEVPIFVVERINPSKNVKYRYSIIVNVDNGKITLKVPSEIMFEKVQYGTNKAYINRISNTQGFEVIDTRDSKNQWRLNIRLSENSQLENGILYREGSRQEFLTTEYIEIYQHKKGHTEKEIVQNVWTENNGILLWGPTTRFAHVGSHAETLEWTLIEGDLL